jgi:hypothetical protein
MFDLFIDLIENKSFNDDDNDDDDKQTTTSIN